jgi:hypothetical protein
MRLCRAARHAGEVCGMLILPKRTDAITCSGACRQALFRKRRAPATV